MKPPIKIRPSEAHRWMRCTASPRLIRENADRIPKDSSVYADEGTLAHTLAAEALVLGYDKDAFEDPEMAENVLSYVEYVLSHTRDADLYVEKQLTTFYNPEQRGFVDALIAADLGITIIDLKYGAGVSVAAEDNEQLLTYALSAVNWLESKGYKYSAKTKVKMVIFQPRVRGEDAEREWTLTLGALKKAGAGMLDTATSILGGDPGVFNPSEDACRWCDAKAFCSAYAESMLEAIPNGHKILKPRGLTPPAAETLDDSALLLLLRRLPEIIKWAGGVKDHTSSRLRQGDRIDGLKLVASSPNRKWIDEKNTEKELLEYLAADEVTKTTLISPSQAEKLLKGLKPEERKNLIGNLAMRPEGSPILAFAEDKRPEWKPIDASTEFEPIDEKPKTKNRKA